MEGLKHIASVAAFVAAAFLIYHDKGNWGWLILAGILVSAN